MKKFKQSIVLFLSMGMMASVVGCSSSKTTEVPKEETQAGKTQETATEEAPVASAGVKGEVVYWSMWNETEPQAEILKSAIARFEEANPEAKVTVQWQGRGVKDLVIPAIQSGQSIDVFDSAPIYINDPAAFLKLDSFLESPAVGSDSTVGETILGGLIAWDKTETAKVGLSGNHAIPYAPYVVSWFYNKDLFEQAGVENVPNTELLATCEKLKQAGIAPIISDDAYITMPFGYQLEKYYTAPVLLDMSNDTKHEGWKDTKLLSALKDMETLYTNGYIADSTATNKYPAGQQQFGLGEAAMYLNASFFPAEISATTGPDFAWGEFAIPTINGAPGVITDVSFGGENFYVSSKTTNEEGALELLRYFVSETTQESFLENGFTPNTSNTPWPAAVADQGPLVDTATSNVPWGGGLSGDFFNGVVSPEVVKVMTGVATADEAFATIQTGLEKFGK